MRKWRWKSPGHVKLGGRSEKPFGLLLGLLSKWVECPSRGGLSLWLPVLFVGTMLVFPLIWSWKILSMSCSAYSRMQPEQGGLFQTLCVVLVTPNKAFSDVSCAVRRVAQLRSVEAARSASAVAQAAWRRRSPSHWHTVLHGTRRSPGIIPGGTAAAGELISLLPIFFLQSLLFSFASKRGCQLDQSEICIGNW